MTVSAPFGFSSYHMPVKKEWLYTTDFSSHILALIDSGGLDKISAKWLRDSINVRIKIYLVLRARK